MNTTAPRFEPTQPVHLVLADPTKVLNQHGMFFRAGELTEDADRRAPVVLQSAGRSR